MTRAARLAPIAACVLAFAPAARAQTEPPPGRVEAGFGVLWSRGVSLGASSANETTSAGPPSPLFSTTSELASAAGIEARLALRLWRAIEPEVTASFARPQLRVTITNDVEAPGTVVASEAVDQFTIAGGASWYPIAPTSAGRVAPFVSGGVGYLRQLHAPGTLAVAGQTFHVGGGVKYLLTSRDRGRVKATGVRLDARVVGRRKGVAFDDQTRWSPTLGASLFARF
jgi:hypothetical protein